MAHLPQGLWVRKYAKPLCLSAVCPFSGMDLKASSSQFNTEGILQCSRSQGLKLFAGIRAVLHCTSDDVPIHLFGFNWHNSTWRGHKVCCSTSCSAA